MDNEELRKIVTTFTFYRQGTSIVKLAPKILEAIRRALPKLPITHFGYSYDLNYGYLTFSREKLESLMDSDCKKFVFSNFESPDFEHTTLNYNLSVELSGFDSRMMDCGTISIFLLEKYRRASKSAFMQCLDEIASQVSTECGELQDLKI